MKNKDNGLAVLAIATLYQASKKRKRAIEHAQKIALENKQAKKNRINPVKVLLESGKEREISQEGKEENA